MAFRRNSVAHAVAMAAGGILVLAAAPARAADRTWSTATSGNFGDGVRWTGGVPGANDTATFDATAGTTAYTVTLTTGVDYANRQLFVRDNVIFAASGASATYSLRDPGNLETNEPKISDGGTLTLGTSGHLVSLTCDNLAVQRNGTLNVLYGSDVNALGYLFVASESGPTAATVLVDGSGSTFSVNGTGSHWIGLYGGTGNLTLQNSATGTIGGALNLGNGGDAAGAGTGNLRVQSSAQLTVGFILAATYAYSGNNATITVGNTGQLTQTGASMLFLGAASGSSALLDVQYGGVFNSGTGQTVVGKTGRINIDGTYNANGDILVDGGTLDLDYNKLNQAAGKSLTVQGGGQVQGYSWTPSAGTTITATGNGTSISPGSLQIERNAQMSINAGADLAVTQLRVGSGTTSQAGTGTLTIDGIGSTLQGGNAWHQIGDDGDTGTLTIRNGATATLGGDLYLGHSDRTNTKGYLNVESGASLTVGDMFLSPTSYGTDPVLVSAVTVSGANSIITQAGDSLLWIGASWRSTASLTIGSGGKFVTGTGLTKVIEGSIAINSGTLEANGDIELSYGDLTRNGGTFTWAPGRTMTLGFAGKANLNGDFDLPANSTIKLTSNSAELNAQTLKVNRASTVAATGGTINCTLLNVGVDNGAGVVTLDGKDTALLATGNSYAGSVVASGGNSGALAVRNGARATFSHPLIVAGDYYHANTGDVRVESGGSLTATYIHIGGGAPGGSGTLTITGAGSSVTCTGPYSSTLGGNTEAPGTLNVLDGGTFAAGPAGIYLNPTGRIIVDGGKASLGTVTRTGTPTITFTRGWLSFAGDLSVGYGGLLGDNVLLGRDTHLDLTGATTIQPLQSIALTGGSLSTTSIINQGTFRFEAGQLTLTGNDGLTVGAGGLLGTNAALGNDQAVNISKTTTVNAGSSLTCNAGSGFSTATLTNSGTVFLNTADVAVGTALNNQTGGRLFVGEQQALSLAAAVTNAGQIQLNGNGALIGGAGALTNTGLILGDGEIAKPLNNNAGGEIRAEAGKRLRFSGVNGANAGRISLLGGTAEFAQSLANGPAGRILGRGTLIVGGAGLANAGNITFSAGLTDIFGAVANNAGGKIIISGAGAATFYDNVTLNAGSELRVSDGCAAVFVGDVTGANAITGPGTKYFEGGQAVLGALVSGGSTVVQPSATLEAGIIRESALTVEGQVKLTQPTGVSVLETLDLGLDGQLNVGQSALVVRNDPPSLGELTALIASARIRSSAAGGFTGVAIALNRTVSGSALRTSFRGESVGPDDILIMNTWNGDANLDGAVDGADYLAIDRGFLAGAAGYAGGDFDYSGGVNGDDFFLIDRSFLGQHAVSAPAALLTTVPEPGTLLGLASLGLLTLRRRHPRTAVRPS